MCFANIFLPICGLSFGFLNKVFHRVEIFNFMKSTLLFFFSFIDWLLVLCVKIHHQTQGHVLIDFVLFCVLLEFFIVCNLSLSLDNFE